MINRKHFSSIEDVLAASGKSRGSGKSAATISVSSRVGAIKDLIDTPKKNGGAPKKSFSSIQDLMEMAEKEREKNRKRYKTFASTLQPKEGSGNGKAAAAASPVDSMAADVMDEFDYAIEAVETARKKVPHDQAVARTMAVNLLLAKQKTPRAEAEDLVARAFRYLEK